MPVDPYRKLYTPDFQSPDVQLPTWTPMGDSEQSGITQATGSMMDLLKKKIGGGASKGAAPMGTGGKAAPMGAVGKTGATGASL
jgi:hypothetical protein